MILNIDPRVDYVFKRIFGREVNEICLLSLINAVLQEPAEHRVTALEIRNPFQDKDFLDDKLSVLDIKALSLYTFSSTLLAVDFDASNHTFELLPAAPQG